MKIKRFKYWVDLLKYLYAEKDIFFLLSYSNSTVKYRIRRFNKGLTPDILLKTNSKEEVKIWVDLRGYRYKELLINDCSKIYYVKLSTKDEEI